MDAGRTEGASRPEAHGAIAQTPEGQGGRQLAIAVRSHGEGGHCNTGRWSCSRLEESILCGFNLAYINAVVWR